MVAVRSAHLNKAGEFDPKKWIASLGISSQQSCERLAETWDYCREKTQGHPQADLLLWRGVEMVEILSTLSMDIDTLRAALLFPLADSEVVSEAAAAPITYEVESPYEAEVDPVTGIYRLKTKTAEDEAESGVDASSAISLGLDQGVPVLDTSEAVGFGESNDYTPNFTLAREESAKESVSQLTLPAFSSLEASESDFGSQSSEGRDDNE